MNWYKRLTNTKYSRYLLLFITILYGVRLLYCYIGYLNNYQWIGNTDETHVYNLGLSFYTKGQFPNWGPDIVYSSSYLIGGMQGFLIGLPLFIWAHPFAPYAFLFLVLTSCLIYLSSYISRLFPDLPKWLVYMMISIAPFTIHTGMHVINPAYVLCFAIPFMLSVIEVFKIFGRQFIHENWRFFWMGIAITSVFQIHASWVFLFILWFAAIVYNWFQAKESIQRIKSLFFSSIGMMFGFLPLIPVIYHYGLDVFLQQGRILDFSLLHVVDFFTLIYSYILMAGYEMNFFDKAYTWNELIKSNNLPGALLFGLLQIIGILLFALQVLLLFWKKWRAYIYEYKRVLLFSSGIISLLTFAFLFSVVRPKPHAVIFLFPLSAIYLFWFLNNLFKTTKVSYWHFGVFASLVVAYYIVIINVTQNLPNLGYRQKAFKAIEKKDASLFETPRYEYPKPIR